MPTKLASPRRPAEPAREDALVAELERLWEHSPARPSGAPARPSRWRSAAYGALTKALVLGWAALLVASLAAAPAAEESVQPAAWVIAASTVILLGVLGAALVAAVLPRVALGASALAAGLGIPVGVACGAAEHHLGAWWMVETGAFGALAAASVACIALRARS